MNDMIRISSTEFGKEVGKYQDVALTQPVVVTRNGRDRTVMISAEEYRRLKRRDREVLGIEDFTEADAEAVRRAQPSPGSAAFDDELTPR
jgi:prevent-host-death family protein